MMTGTLRGGGTPVMQATSLLDAADALVEELVAAGVSASVDVRDVSPPAVLVSAPQLTFDLLGAGAYSAEFVLFIIGPDSGGRASLEVLGKLLAQVRNVWPGRTADPDIWQSPGGGDPLPCYRYPVLATVLDTDLD